MLYEITCIVSNHLCIRSLFIWRPAGESEPGEQRAEEKIVVCGKGDAKRKKFGGDSDDESDGDMFPSKGKKIKNKKVALKSTKYSIKKC